MATTTGASSAKAQFPGLNALVVTRGLTSNVVLVTSRRGVTAVVDERRDEGI